MDGDNENGAINNENGEKGESSAEFTAPGFAIPGDEGLYDWVLSQFRESMTKFDGADWFGRVIAYAPDGAKYSMTNLLDDTGANSLEDIKARVAYRQYSIVLNSPRVTSYDVAPGATTGTATMTADLVVTDNVTGTVLTSRSVTIINTIKQTWQITSTTFAPG